jgi:hypothetical protein
MSDDKKYDTKYNLENAKIHKSAVGDYAQVNNYFPAGDAQADPATAELRRLFQEVNERLAALDEADRKAVAPMVEQAAEAAAAIQEGDAGEEKQSFLEKRLIAIYNMRRDIGEVIVAALVSPKAGIALTLQKIGQKVKETVGS